MDQQFSSMLLRLLDLRDALRSEVRKSTPSERAIEELDEQIGEVLQEIDDYMADLKG